MSTRGRSSYFIFAASVRPQIKTEHKGLSVAEQAKIIGEKWQALSDEEKKHFEELAAAEKASKAEAASLVQTPSVKMAGGNDDEDEDEVEAGPETVTVPLSRIKKMLKYDPECSNITGDAAFLITKATELFIQFLAGECAEVADESGRKTINESDLGIAIHRVPTLAAILRSDFPKHSKKEIEEIRLAKEKAKAEKKAASAALAEAAAGESDGGKDGEGEAGEKMDTLDESAAATSILDPEKAVVPADGGKKQGSLVTMMARARELAAANPKRRSGDKRSDDENDDDDAVIVIDSSTSKKASASKGLMDRFAVSLKDPEEKRKFWADSFLKSDEHDDSNEQNVGVRLKKKVVKRRTKKNAGNGSGEIDEIIIDESTDKSNDDKDEEEEEEEEEEGEEEEEEEEEVSNEERIMERIRKVQIEEEKQRKARLKARLKLTDADNQALEEEGDIDLGFIRQRVSGKKKRRSSIKKSSSAKTKAKNKAAAKKKSVKIVEIDGEDEGEEEQIEEEEEPDRGRPDSSLQVELVADLPDDDKVEVDEIDEDDDEDD